MLERWGFHSSYYADLPKVGVKLAIMALVLFLAWWIPMPESLRGIAGYEPLHTFFETFSIVVSGLIFAVIWNAPERRENSIMLLMACAYLGVALLDFSHMLSIQGMPDYVIPSSPEKAINFWLAARLLSVITLLAVAVGAGREIKLALNRYVLLAGVLMIVALVHWLFLLHADWVSRTFITGQGLTDFKKNSEYFIIAINIAAVWILLRRMRNPLAFNAPALLGVLVATGLSEIFFTMYGDVTDIFLVLGHLYKIVAYIFPRVQV